LRASDLAPAKVWASLEDRAYRSWERSVKFYESIKFVYQIQTKLRDWQQQQEEEQRPADDHRLPAKGSQEPKTH
jgi:hypothetical protein